MSNKCRPSNLNTSTYDIIDDDNIYYINEASLSTINEEDNGTPIKLKRSISSTSSDEVDIHKNNNHPDTNIIINNDSVSINIQNIEKEYQLNDYMETHYTNKLMDDLDKININDVSNNKNSNSKSFYSMVRKEMDMLHNVSEISFFDNDCFQNNSPVSMSPVSSEASVSASEKEPSSLKKKESFYFDKDKDKDRDRDRDRDTNSNSNSSKEKSLSSRRNSRKIHFRRLSFNEVEKSLDKYYNLENNKYSSEFDIMITYLKGQKNIYTQSKNIANIQLNILFIPSLFLTASITIFAPVMNNYGWAGILISVCNALLTLTISLINYLKLQSNVDMYFNLANQYDKLETSIEITSNKLFFIEKDTDQNEMVLQKIQFIESKLTEIKESNPILIPELIKRIFPVISHINIFSFIKKIETYKKKLIIKFRDIKNEIGYIIYKWKQREINIFQDMPNPTAEFIREQKRFFFLLKIKEKMKDELIHYKNAYGYIDDIISKEIRSAESYKVWWYAIMCGKNNKLYNKYTNPVIQSILNIIFFEE
jgi:hypothetical protein